MALYKRQWAVLITSFAIAAGAFWWLSNPTVVPSTFSFHPNTD